MLGTGQGLSNELLNKADFLLAPLKGMPHYNHLSVRSAAAIILDRWLGLRTQNSVITEKVSIPIAKNDK